MKRERKKATTQIFTIRLEISLQQLCKSVDELRSLNSNHNNYYYKSSIIFSLSVFVILLRSMMTTNKADIASVAAQRRYSNSNCFYNCQVIDKKKSNEQNKHKEEKISLIRKYFRRNWIVHWTKWNSQWIYPQYHKYVCFCAQTTTK